MEKEQLGKTGLKADFPNVEPEKLHDCGHRGESETQVSEGQHGEEEVHWLVERWLCVDDSEDGDVAHDGGSVEAEEGDGDPETDGFKSRDAHEDEVERIVSGVGYF